MDELLSEIKRETQYPVNYLLVLINISNLRGDVFGLLLRSLKMRFYTNKMDFLFERVNLESIRERPKRIVFGHSKRLV